MWPFLTFILELIDPRASYEEYVAGLHLRGKRLRSLSFVASHSVRVCSVADKIPESVFR